MRLFTQKKKSVVRHFILEVVLSDLLRCRIDHSWLGKYLIIPAKYVIEFNNNKFEISGLPPNRDIPCMTNDCGCRINPFIWVSHSKRMIYFEVPKSGSTSVKFQLAIKKPSIKYAIQRVIELETENNCNKVRFKIKHPSIISREDIVKKMELLISELNGYLFNNHTSYQGKIDKNKTPDFVPFYGGIQQVKEVYPDYFSFSFVRSPVGRLLSNYLTFTQKPRQKVVEELFKKPAERVTLDEFIDNISLYKNHHWCPQISFLPRKENGEPDIDFLGKLETIKSDWAGVCAISGLDSELVQLNKSKKRKKRTPLSPEQILKIEKLYKEDFLYFNYSSSE